MPMTRSWADDCALAVSAVSKLSFHPATSCVGIEEVAFHQTNHPMGRVNGIPKDPTAASWPASSIVIDHARSSPTAITRGKGQGRSRGVWLASRRSVDRPDEFTCLADAVRSEKSLSSLSLGRLTVCRGDIIKRSDANRGRHVRLGLPDLPSDRRQGATYSNPDLETNAEKLYGRRLSA
jgi:hypothetical protein